MTTASSVLLHPLLPFGFWLLSTQLPDGYDSRQTEMERLRATPVFECHRNRMNQVRIKEQRRWSVSVSFTQHTSPEATTADHLILLRFRFRFRFQSSFRLRSRFALRPSLVCLLIRSCLRFKRRQCPAT